MYMSFLNVCQRDKLTTKDQIVYSFYSDSFSKLYNVKSNDINYVKADSVVYNNKNFLVSLSKEVIGNLNKKPEYFFDIRINEEFENPAPEYSIIYDLEMNNSNPVSIKGMGSLSLVVGLQTADVYLNEVEDALFSFSRLNNPYDDFNEKRDQAVSFVLSKKKGEYNIESYGMFDSIEELKKKCDLEVIDIIFSEFSCNHFSSSVKIENVDCLNSFFNIYSMIESKNNSKILMLLEHKKQFGYILININ